jgi:uncharacterized repeat protein (TIGR03803 family)
MTAVLTTLVTFNNNNGSTPLYEGLITDANGDLFGTTEYGGASGYGTVFEIAKTNTGYASAPTALVSFNNGNGAYPCSGLIADANGDLFGTTEQGGASGDGTVFEITGSGFVADSDTGEQAALSLAVGNTDIGAAAASAVPFMIAGLDTEDTGTVTFTDRNGKTVQISVNGGETSYSANLTTLADGTITSSLAVNTDSAGNWFTPVAGTTVTLDRDVGEQAALKLTVGDTDIGVVAASAVPFMIAGLDAEDTGTVTFTDRNGKTVQISVNGGETSYSANLTTLADGTITSSLAANTDSAGNWFTPVAGTTVTLARDAGEQAALKLTVGNTDIGAVAASAVPFTIAGLDAEDTGTVTFTNGNGKTVQVSVNGGQTSYSANLTTLAGGTITSSLAVNTDSAGIGSRRLPAPPY